MTVELSTGDRDLLAQLQDRFPLCATPYATLAWRLVWREEEVMSRVCGLRLRGVLRQIGGIFSTRRLGYASTLVALSVQPEKLDEVAAAVSRHPGVSHNYGRRHTYNLWFTLAVPPGRDLQREVEALVRQPGVRQWLALPVLRTFKIDARLSLDEEAEARPQQFHGPAAAGEDAATISPSDVPLVRALQADLPVSSRPFLVLGRRYGVSEGAILAAAERFLAGGIMRRYGATLRHREVGYEANAMVCWQLPAEEVASAGEAAAGHPAVSHCYERAAHLPDWPYQLFTMIHGRSQSELARALGQLQSRVHPQRLAILPTVREYKKARLRYFEEGETR